MNNDFLNNLGYTTKNGLVHNLDEAQNNVERLYIEEVKRLIVPANAVFFRRFYRNEEDEQPYFSTPAVCIFHQTDSFFNSEAHKKLHAALWSSGKTEIYVIQGESRIDIINARKPAKRIDNNDVSLDKNDKTLVLVHEAIQGFDDSRFSAHLFGSGTFWEQSDFQQTIDDNSNPYVFLLGYLMGVRHKLLKDSSIQLEATTIDKLLITCILIKFLEEIKDDNSKHTLKAIYKKHHLKTETFEEGLRNGKCLDILNDLASEFNGKIFNTLSAEERSKIAQANLVPIADFLSADVDIQTNQLFLWKQYDFKHLPAEVISAIYENFIHAEAERNEEKKKDVVYTPLHLVNLMIDESMPLDQPELFENNSFKVLDPACGSGVFLVAAYKRMLQWWAINNWRKTGRVEYPDKDLAKQILEDNIFGVDILEVAALVSIFGLTTAFLDKLTPKEIWNNLKFKDLSEKNVKGLNFIDWAKQVLEEKKRWFDLVIGNPPFNSSAKGTISDKEIKELFGKQVPGNKLALKFFEAALYFGQKVCMIIPSNIFLYNKNASSQAYRKEIFSNYTVDKIYDFTHLRRDLFHKSADTPVVSLMVKNTPSNYQVIEHIVVKRQLLSEKRMRFEIDYYDKHQVRWDWAVDEKKQFVWKTNLLGGGRLFHLVYRLSLLDTLNDFIERKKRENSEWIFQDGYKNLSTKPISEVITYLHNQFRVNNITKDGELLYKDREECKYFGRPRPENLYKMPFILIHKKIGNNFFPVGIQKKFPYKYLVFNNRYMGLHSPESSLEDLEKIYKYLKFNETFCRFWILVQSPNTLINHETTFIKNDLEILPFNFKENFLNLNNTETIIQNDVLKYYIHLGKAITQKSAGKVLHDPTLPRELEAFGETYCDALNEIYAEDGKSWQAGQVIQTPTFVSYQFGFGKDGGLKNEFKAGSEKEFHSLLKNTNSNKGVNYNRIIRYYEHVDSYDCVYFIKPRARRYWLQSIALKDADDTFMDLKKAGY